MKKFFKEMDNNNNKNDNFKNDIYYLYIYEFSLYIVFYQFV